MQPHDGWELEAELYSPDAYLIEVGLEMLAGLAKSAFSLDSTSAITAFMRTYPTIYCF